jgi:hypothetical protein
VNPERNTVVIMTQDLLQVLLPFLGDGDSQSLFELSSAEGVLENKDTGVQKRGYKILSKLVDGGKIQLTPENLIQELESKVEGVSAAAKKVCYILDYLDWLLKFYRIDCTCLHCWSTYSRIHPCIFSPP